MKREDRGKRYTIGQEQLLRVNQKKLTADEKEQYRKLLAPRSRYLPATDEECIDLVQFMLKEYYTIFTNCILALQKDFEELVFEWKIGDKRQILYYKITQNNKNICNIGIHLDSIEASVVFDEKLCLAFEKERACYNRLSTQWIFDAAPFMQNKKILYFDLTEPVLQVEFFKILLLKINHTKK